MYSTKFISSVRCKATHSGSIFSSCDSTRKRVNFYTNGSKIRIQWFRVSHVGRPPFETNETSQQIQQRDVRKKIFFRCRTADDFRAVRSSNSSLIHTHFIRRNESGARRQLAWLQFTPLCTSHDDDIRRIADAKLISLTVNNIPPISEICISLEMHSRIFICKFISYYIL